MRLHYLVKLNIGVFVKIGMTEKRNSTNFTYLPELLLGFTKINISEHKHYFSMLAELNKYGIQCSAYLRLGVTEAQRRRQCRRPVAPKAENARSQQWTSL